MDDNVEETGSAIIYTRVSTEMQLDGMGIEAQTKECEKYCMRNELNVKGIYSDQAKSGGFHQSKPNKNMINGLTMEQFNLLSEREKKDELRIAEIKGIEHRDQLKNALRTCKTGDVFVSFALSRLARNVEMGFDLLKYLREKKVIIVIVKDGLDSRFKQTFKPTYTMFSIMAEMERDSMIDRVKSSMTLKKELGEFVGNIPYGYMLANGKQSDLVPNPEEQENIKLMKELRNKTDPLGKKMSYSAIAEELNNRQIKTKNGKKWSHTQVIRIVNDKFVPKNTKGSYKAKMKGIENSFD
jgi:site-specific DNA recombinase